MGSCLQDESTTRVNEIKLYSASEAEHSSNEYQSVTVQMPCTRMKIRPKREHELDMNANTTRTRLDHESESGGRRRGGAQDQGEEGGEFELRILISSIHVLDLDEI